MNDQNELGSRIVFAWRQGHPRTLADAIAQPDNVDRLADAIAGSPAHFFNQGERLVWLDPTGTVVPVNVRNGREILGKCVVTKRLVNCDGKGQVEYHPFAFAFGSNTALEPDEKVLIELVTKKLKERVPIAEP